VDTNLLNKRAANGSQDKRAEKDNSALSFLVCVSEWSFIHPGVWQGKERPQGVKG
jgi:hypothetical protein